MGLRIGDFKIAVGDEPVPILKKETKPSSKLRTLLEFKRDLGLDASAANAARGRRSHRKKALLEARKANPHAVKYLNSNKKIGVLPEFYGFGDENETVICAYHLARA
jgi:hypothetical protein